MPSTSRGASPGLVDAVIMNYFVPFTLRKESTMMDQFAPILRKACGPDLGAGPDHGPQQRRL